MSNKKDYSIKKHTDLVIKLTETRKALLDPNISDEEKEKYMKQADKLIDELKKMREENETSKKDQDKTKSEKPPKEKKKHFSNMWKSIKKHPVRTGLGIAAVTAGTAYGAKKIYDYNERKKVAYSCYQTARGDKDRFKQCLLKSRKFKPDMSSHTIDTYYYKAKNKFQR